MAQGRKVFLWMLFALTLVALLWWGPSAMGDVGAIRKAHHTGEHKQLVIGEKSGHANLVFCVDKKLAYEIQRTAREDGWTAAGFKVKMFMRHGACGIINAYIVPHSRGRTIEVAFPDGDKKTTYVFPFYFFGEEETYYGLTDLKIVAEGGNNL